MILRDQCTTHLLFLEPSDGQFKEDYAKILQPGDAQERYLDDDLMTCRTLNNKYELDLKNWYRVKAVSYLLLLFTVKVSIHE